MSGPARSLFIYGIYLAVVSITLIVTPNLVLPLLGLPTSSEVWIRVAAVLALFLAFYDIQAARNEITSFIGWTVFTRGSVIFIFGTFVLLGFAGPGLLVFGLVDLLAATWTALALSSSRRADKQQLGSVTEKYAADGK